jgi:hypothetical protein
VVGRKVEKIKNSNIIYHLLRRQRDFVKKKKSSCRVKRRKKEYNLDIV